MENTTVKSALLVMDMLVGITANFADTPALVNKIGMAIAHARGLNIPVIYVALGFRNGTPEISMYNKSFSNFKERYAGVEDFSKIIAELTPQDGEVIVYKRRVSAFTGSDLEVILRAQNIQHVILSGISTSGVVLSTTREAADKDYKITILADCCGDPDPEIHHVLTTKVFPRQAEVLTLEAWSKK